MLRVVLQQSSGDVDHIYCSTARAADRLLDSLLTTGNGHAFSIPTKHLTSVCYGLSKNLTEMSSMKLRRKYF